MFSMKFAQLLAQTASSDSSPTTIDSSGAAATVPDDNVAHLMYYLDCITLGLGFDVLQEDLVRYQEYQLLDPNRVSLLYAVVTEDPDLGLQKILNKALFMDDDCMFLRPGQQNKFVSYNEIKKTLGLPGQRISLSGTEQTLGKALVCTSEWFETHYLTPLEEAGEGGLVNINPMQHRSRCTKCKRSYFTGWRYICLDDQGLDTCSRNECSRSMGGFHDENWSQSWMKIYAPAYKPIYVPRNGDSEEPYYPLVVPTKRNLPPPPLHSATQQGSMITMLRTHIPKKDSSMANPTSLAPGRPPSPPRNAAPPQNSNSPHNIAIPQEANPLQVIASLADLEIGSSPSAVQNANENIFSGNNSSDREIQDGSASEAIELESALETGLTLSPDDRVVLKGLKKAAMNGKNATVISADDVKGSAQIRVDGMEKTFNIKYENLEIDDDSEWLV